MLFKQLLYIGLSLLVAFTVWHVPGMRNKTKNKENIMSEIEANKEINRTVFIDKFFVPAPGKEEFYERMQINRKFIRSLPGFIEDAAYACTDKEDNLICVTVAIWEDLKALNMAREAVQEEYRRQGFDPAEMFRRLNITADRGVYQKLKD